MRNQAVPAAAVAAFTIVLSACGGGGSDVAVNACAEAVEEKLGQDRNFRIDRADMAANARPEGEDVVHVQSSVVFDPGLPREYTQVFDCKARIGAGGEPSVISLTFTW